MSTANVDKIRIYRFRNQIVLEMNNHVNHLSASQCHLLSKNLSDAAFDLCVNHFSQSQFTDTIIQDTH